MSLRKNISWSFIGNAAFAACQWGILIAIAKLATVRDVGLYSYGLAVCAPVFSFTNLQIAQIAATDVRDQHTYGHYLGFRIVSTAVGLAVVSIAAPIICDDRATREILLVVAAAKAVECISDCFYGFHLKNGNAKQVALSLLLRGLLSVIGVAVILLLGGGISSAMLSLFLVWAVVAVFLDRFDKTRSHANDEWTNLFRPSFDKHEFFKMWLLAWPMGIVIMLNVLNLNMPRYAIKSYLDESALGYYAAVSYLLMAGATVINAVGQSGTPKLAEYYVSNPSAYAALVNKMQVIAISLGVAGILVSGVGGKQILSFIYGDPYMKYQTLLLWVMVSALALYCAAIYGAAITAARRFRQQATTAVVVTTSICGALLILLPRQGLVGAAQAVAIGMAIKLGIQYCQYCAILRVQSK